jgi:hypothetical protein
MLSILTIIYIQLSSNDLFGCTGFGYPFFLAVLSFTALMSLSYLVCATFESSKFSDAFFRESTAVSNCNFSISVFSAGILVPIFYVFPVFLFRHISEPVIKNLEIFLPINAYLLGIDLFQNYLNAGE